MLGGIRMFGKKLENKDCLDLSVDYERDNAIQRMDIIENLEKQGVRVISL